MTWPAACSPASTSSPPTPAGAEPARRVRSTTASPCRPGRTGVVASGPELVRAETRRKQRSVSTLALHGNGAAEVVRMVMTSQAPTPPGDGAPPRALDGARPAPVPAGRAPLRDRRRQPARRAARARVARRPGPGRGDDPARGRAARLVGLRPARGRDRREQPGARRDRAAAAIVRGGLERPGRRRAGGRGGDPATRRYDRVLKPTLYAEAGIRGVLAGRARPGDARCCAPTDLGRRRLSTPTAQRRGRRAGQARRPLSGPAWPRRSWLRSWSQAGSAARRPWPGPSAPGRTPSRPSATSRRSDAGLPVARPARRR